MRGLPVMRCGGKHGAQNLLSLHVWLRAGRPICSQPVAVTGAQGPAAKATPAGWQFDAVGRSGHCWDSCSFRRKGDSFCCTKYSSMQQAEARSDAWGGRPLGHGHLPPPVPELARPAPCDQHLQLLQVRALFGHHSSQELVLEPVPGDQEVDQGALGLHLGLVVWVEVLGVQDQAELGVVLHLLVANLNESGGQCRKGLEGLPVAGDGNTTETANQSAQGPVLRPSSGYWERTSVASLALVPFSGPRPAHPEDEPALPLAGWLTQPGCMSC